MHYLIIGLLFVAGCSSSDIDEDTKRRMAPCQRISALIDNPTQWKWFPKRYSKIVVTDYKETCKLLLFFSNAVDLELYRYEMTQKRLDPLKLQFKGAVYQVDLFVGD